MRSNPRDSSRNKKLNTRTSMYRKLMIVVCIAIFFSVGCVVSDTAPYNPPIDFHSIAWAAITVVNHITVWFLASVLIGWRLAETKRESLVLGAMFGFVAMAGYYALLPVTTEVTYEWQHVLLISVSLVGGAFAALLGQAARQFPLLLTASTAPLLGTIILRLPGGMNPGSSSVLTMIQVGILAAFVGIVVFEAHRNHTKK